MKKVCMKISISMLAGTLGLSFNAVAADDMLKIGFLSTLSGPGAAIGEEVRDGFNLAVELADGQLGGVKTKVITADDQQNANEGRQAAERLLRRDKVDIMTGMVFSNVLLPVMPRVLKEDKVYISVNTGPEDYASKKCHENYYTVSWQNEDIPSAMGKYVTEKKHKKVYLIAPNYPGGKESIHGFKRFYEGDIADEVYVKVGQLDFSAEIAQIRASGADSVFFFLPGGMGVSFIKQLANSGVDQQTAVYTPGFSADEDTISAVGESLIGMMNASQWSPDLDNEANHEFVKRFEEKYGRLPSMYAAQAYDGARLIDAAVKEIDGEFSNTEKLRKALKKADFDSVRGSFAFNNNNYPIQNYYMREVYKNDDGVITNKIVETVFENYEDPFAKQCEL